jgi:hypothetical protein
LAPGSFHSLARASRHRTEVEAMQPRLTELGFHRDRIDGKAIC